jgi:hypothetical protein
MTRLPFAATQLYLERHGIETGSPTHGTTAIIVATVAAGLPVAFFARKMCISFKNRVGGDCRSAPPRWVGRGRVLLALCSIGVSLIASGCGEQQSSSHAPAAATIPTTPTHAPSSSRGSANRCVDAGAAASRGPPQLLAAARCAFLAQPAVEVSQVGAYTESGPVPLKVERQSISFIRVGGQVRAYTSAITTNLGVEKRVFTGRSGAAFVPLDYEERVPDQPLGESELLADRWLTGPGATQSDASVIPCLNSLGSLIIPQQGSLAIAGRATVDGRRVVILTEHADPPTGESRTTLYIAARGPALPLRSVLHQSATAPAQPGCAPAPRPRFATDTFSYQPLKPITLPASTVDPQQVGTIVPPPDAAVIITRHGYTPITRALVAFWTRLASSGRLGSKWQRIAASGQVLTVLITDQWTAMQAASAGITISNAQIAHALTPAETSLLPSAGVPLYILRATTRNALLVAKTGPFDRAHPQALRTLLTVDRNETICASGAISFACRNG